MLKRIQNMKIVRLYLTFTDIFSAYEISQTASGIAYYFTLAIFPFLMFLAALVGILQFPADALEKLLAPLLTKTVCDTILAYYAYLTSVSSVQSLIFGLGFSLYSASRAVNALTYGVNKVYHTHLKRSYFVNMMYSALFTVGISAVLILAMLVISAGGNLAAIFGFAKNIRLPFAGKAGFVYLIAAGSAFLVLTAFYSLAPANRVRLRYALPGSVLCLAGLHAISFGVSVYVRISTRFSVLYGSIGAVIILLLWLYFFGICVMLGALLNRYIEKRRSR